MLTSFKLKGHLWSANGEETMRARKLIANILEVLSAEGWEIHAAVETSRDIDSTSSIFFKKTVPSSRTASVVSLHETDKVRVMGDNTIIECVVSAVQRYWTKGIQKEDEKYGLHQVKLKGRPFTNLISMSAETVVFLVGMLQQLHNKISRVHSINISSKIGSDGHGTVWREDLDSLFYMN